MGGGSAKPRSCPVSLLMAPRKQRRGATQSLWHSARSASGSPTVNPLGCSIPVPGLVPGTHVFPTVLRKQKTWMPGIKPGTGLIAKRNNIRARRRAISLGRAADAKDPPRNAMASRPRRYLRVHRVSIASFALFNFELAGGAPFSLPHRLIVKPLPSGA